MTRYADRIVEDVLMGVDAIPEDVLEPMGEIMRLVSYAVVTAVSQGSWKPRPIAQAIVDLIAEKDEQIARLNVELHRCEGTAP